MKRQSGDSCPCRPHREIGVLTPGLSLAVSRGEPLGSEGVARAPHPCRPTAPPVPGPPLLASCLAWRGAAWLSRRRAYLRAPSTARGRIQVFLLLLVFSVALYLFYNMYLHGSEGKSIEKQLTLVPHGGWGADPHAVENSRVTLNPPHTSLQSSPGITRGWF